VKIGLRMTLVSAAFVCSALQLQAQNCPPKDYEGPTDKLPISTVYGTIRDHNDLRGWIGLQLSPAVCGQTELQLTFIHGDSSASYRATEALKGCKAKVTGRIDNSPTGSYATDIFIEDGMIEPDASCHPSPEKPDPFKATIPSDLQSYQATVTLNFADTSKPMSGAGRRADGKTDRLTPWEAYIDPWLNGSEDLLWVKCRDGFHLQNAYTEIAGKQAKPENWLNKETPGLSAPDKPAPSSITITCEKYDEQRQPRSRHKAN